MKGAALEGGGARGAYHIGVMEALYECGHDFDGYVGTSIGSINAAALAQGDFDGLKQMWADLSPGKLFSPTIARLMQAVGEKMFSMDFVTDLARSLSELQKGVDTDGMKALIRSVVDEDALRRSGKLFALATLDATDLRPRELYLDDIPQGMLIEYLMASASFPGFKPEKIAGHEYADGGLFNNCPVNLLTDRGYEEVYAIRTLGPGLYHLPETDAKISVIEPSRDLGNVMSFDNALIQRNMRIGYLDGLRAEKGLKGRRYFVEGCQGMDAAALLMGVDEQTIQTLRSEHLYQDLPAQRLLLEKMVPDLGAYLKLQKDFGYEDLALALLESAAQEAGLDELRVWDIKELAAQVAAMDIHPAQSTVGGWLFTAKYQAAVRGLAMAIARRLR